VSCAGTGRVGETHEEKTDAIPSEEKYNLHEQAGQYESKISMPPRVFGFIKSILRTG
jgi:hypothetical protein